MQYHALLNELSKLLFFKSSIDTHTLLSVILTSTQPLMADLFQYLAQYQYIESWHHFLSTPPRYFLKINYYKIVTQTFFTNLTTRLIPKKFFDNINS
jgi:hypothetical protein